MLIYLRRILKYWKKFYLDLETVYFRNGFYQSIVGDIAPALNYPQNIQAFDSSDIQQAALKYLSVDAYGVVVFRPKSVSLMDNG
ncbi:hypothetical protein AFK68_05825 [Hydrocoleum sp. CS-953]|nr:hypothetical protein AFK68_05825 [Hydrocoleum sp. CS-953]